MRIFVSYSSRALDRAEPIALALKGRGHTVFFDRHSLPSGETFHDRISNEIAQCDAVVFLISEDWLHDKKYTLSELELTKKKWPTPNRRVLPVMLDPIDPSILPAYLRDVTILAPKGNPAAEVASAVDDFGWKGLTKMSQGAYATLLTGLIGTSALFGVVLKNEYYYCWTISGFLSDPKSIALIAIAAIPPILFLYGFSRLRSATNVIGRFTSKIVETRSFFPSVAILVTLMGSQAFLALTRPPGNCATRLMNNLSDHNWIAARKELARLTTSPLYDDIKDTCNYSPISAYS